VRRNERFIYYRVPRLAKLTYIRAARPESIILIIEDDYLITSKSFKKIQAFGILTITIDIPTRKLKIKLFYIVLVPTFFINIIALLRATKNNIYFNLGRNLLYYRATSKIIYYIK
jgi:hypothetical protein